MNQLSPDLLDQVCDLLSHGVTQTFETLLELEATPSSPFDLHTQPNPLVVGSVGFVGVASGVAYIQVTAPFARTLTARMLKIPEVTVDSDELVNDVMGELANIIVGSVKSRLCDSGNKCALSMPSVVRGKTFYIERGDDSNLRSLTFRCGEEHITVDLLMNT